MRLKKLICARPVDCAQQLIGLALLAGAATGCNHPMATTPPPPPPNRPATTSAQESAEGNVADMRDAFARREPLSADEIAAARAFVDSKIEMVESDPHLTAQQKAEAVAALKAKRP